MSTMISSIKRRKYLHHKTLMPEMIKEQALLHEYLKKLFYEAYALYHEKEGLSPSELEELNKENPTHMNHIKVLLNQYENTETTLWNNMILIKWFWSSLWGGFANKSYEKKVKKEDTIPLFFQHFSPWKATYFNALTFSLRSKKNSRPIHIRYDKLNTGLVGGLMGACKDFLNPSLAMSQRRSGITRYVMSMTFIGKDQELVNEEDALTAIYKSYKNPLFWVEIKNYWEKKTMFQLLAKTFITPEMKEFINSNKEAFEFVKKLMNEKAEHLRNMNFFFDDYQQAEACISFFKSHWYEASHLGREHFTKYFEHYFNTYIFFEEHFVNWLKGVGYTVTKLYKKENMDGYRQWALEGDCFNLDLIQGLYDIDANKGKALWKRLIEAFDFSYQEDALNSFLTQPDLSNSLELCQDVYQEFLRSIGIAYDDKYITRINAHMLREPKGEKEDCLFKNINWVALSKIHK